MNKYLHSRRKQILAEMGKITMLRQGSLSEQYYTKTYANGRKHKQGPYYVLTWYEGGAKKTKRIPKDEVTHVEDEIQNYQRMKKLFNNLLDVTEQMTTTTKIKRRKKEK